MTVKNKPDSEDYLRFGILEYENGLIDKSWQHVSLALLSDPCIGNRKPAYKSYISRIIQKKFGERTDVSQFLKDHRLKLNNSSNL